MVLGGRTVMAIQSHYFLFELLESMFRDRVSLRGLFRIGVSETRPESDVLDRIVIWWRGYM